MSVLKLNRNRIINLNVCLLFVLTQAIVTLSPFIMTKTAHAATQDCAGSLLLLAKYEVNNGGAFVFKEGQNVATFSSIVPKPGSPNEVIGFNWASSIPADEVLVKASTSTFTQSGNELTSGAYPLNFTPAGGSTHAVSNVVFCYDPEASITIIKNAIPNDAQDFTFTATGQGVSNFTLDDDNNNTLSDSRTFNNLPAGTYTFTEGYLDGWYLDDISCPNITETKNLETRTVSLTVSAGQSVSCTFTNRTSFGSVTVNKKVDGNGDGIYEGSNAEANTLGFDWGLDATTPARDMGSSATNVPTGNHTVTEDNVNGYVFTGWYLSSDTQFSCANPRGTTLPVNITVIKDATTSVTLCNQIQKGSLTIVKDARPNSAQDFTFTRSFGSNFSLDDDSDSTLSNTQSYTNLVPGSYTVTEQAVTGWDLSSLTCVGADHQVNDNSVTVTLDPGENATCNFVNQKRGKITVNKITNPAGDQTNFGITASGNGTIYGGAGRTLNTSTPVVYEVGYGTYAVGETTIPAGWAETSNDCTALVIDVNNLERSCTIVNTKLARLKIVKDALPDHAQDFAFTDVNLPGDGFSLDDDTDSTLQNAKQFIDLLPGMYSVSEQPTPGWSLTDLGCDTNNFTATGATVSVNLAAGQEAICTFENTKLGSIGGTKFNVNADGSIVSPLSGWTIFIDGNNDGILDSAEPSNITDASGNYSFTDLTPGMYTIREILMSGWTQIFGPSPVTLTPGQNSSGNDFGNFQNGSINGYKFNDANGNGQYDNEPKLSGWTITLFNDGNDQDADLDDIVATTQTDQNGDYSFINLTPGTYAVCETQQTNWVQTFPANNGCYTVVINISGETNPGTNFGNQSRGNIQVIKNVDTDGDGDIDISGATDWTWDIDGSGNFATGTTQNVATGSYAVSEDMKTDYHVTSSSCTGEDAPASPTTLLNVTVSVGETVVCTFVNTRDTGTITVRKIVDPTSDDGKFDLNIDDITFGDDVSHGQGTGTITVPTGTHSVSETAGTGTDLSDYISSFECNNQLNGQGTSTGDFIVTANQDVVCTFTNVRKSQIIVIKQTLPDGDPQVFDFDASYDRNGFSLSDGQSNDSGNLAPGTYSVSENIPTGWDLDSAECSDESSPDSISLAAGETVTCVFTNTKRGSIGGTKFRVEAGATDITAGVPLSGWTIFIDLNRNGELDTDEPTDLTDASGSYEFDDIVSGDYRVCEVPQTGWVRVVPAGESDCLEITLRPGEESVNNDFGNRPVPGQGSVPLPPSNPPVLVTTGESDLWKSLVLSMGLLILGGALLVSRRTATIK
jgi:hypothetical protein